MKQLIILAVILGGGFLAYKYFPALQTKANETIQNLTAWDEDDIKARPIEYIDWAKGQLENNIGKFETALEESDKNHQTNVDELNRFTEQVRNGDQVTKEMKDVFKLTEENGTWPVTFRGKEYSRDGFVAQVESFLGDKKNAEALAARYQKLVDGGAKQKQLIRSKVAELRRNITTLESEKQGIKTAQLTDESEGILLSVNDIVGKTSSQVAKVDDILSLEEFSMAKDQADAEAAEKAAEDAAAAATLDFLNS